MPESGLDLANLFYLEADGNTRSSRLISLVTKAKKKKSNVDNVFTIYLLNNFAMIFKFKWPNWCYSSSLVPDPGL